MAYVVVASVKDATSHACCEILFHKTQCFLSILSLFSFHCFCFFGQMEFKREGSTVFLIILGL